VVQHRLARAEDVAAPAVEVDVVVSHDGVPFVHHAYEVHGVGLASEASADRLRAAGVLPLAELLGAAALAGVEVALLDVRSGFRPELTAHLAVARVLVDAGWADRAVVVDWDWVQVAELRRRVPDVHVGAATRCRLPGLDALLVTHPVDYLFLTWDLVRPADVATCHARGVAVGTFEGWEPGFAARASDLAVDVVLADDPAACGRRLAEAQRTR
jgi:glycerophosphoryl diester phosphodiesterase